MGATGLGCRCTSREWKKWPDLSCRKQSKCPAMDEQIKKIWHIHTMDYYSVLKRKKILIKMVCLFFLSFNSNVGKGIPHTTKFLLPAGCPTTQFSSDILYSDIASDPTG